MLGIESECFVVYLSCVYICQADHVELPVILFGILHVVQMKRSSVCRVIVEILVLGLLVVVYKIPYSSCMIYHVRTYS